MKINSCPRNDLALYIAIVIIIILLIVSSVRLWIQNQQAKKSILKKESELVRAAEEIRYLCSEIENLAYSVSHDLNAPLRAVEGFARILQRDYQDKIDEEGREFLELIRNNAQQLKALLDGVLKYSRLGRNSLNITSFEMNALIDEVITDLTPVISQKNCIDVSQLPEIHGDKELIRQLMCILLRNAINFSQSAKEPGIRVWFQDEGPLIHLIIKDNGIGFEPGYEEKMFGLFQKLHSEKEGSGLGIGLALAKRIAQRHHGKIWAEGKTGEGATFFVALPKLQNCDPAESNNNAGCV